MTPERKERLLSVLQKRQNGLAVILENVFDPHNISAVMRSCDAVGIQDIYVLTTKMPRHNKWGAKSSSSAAKWLTVHQYTDAKECFAAVRQQYKKILATHLSADASDLYAVDFTDSIAILFGNEQSGVSPEVLPYTDGNFVIPQVGLIKSLNISVACAVTIYEAYRQKKVAGHYDAPSLPDARISTLLEEWSLPDALKKTN